MGGLKHFSKTAKVYKVGHTYATNYQYSRRETTELNPVPAEIQ